MRDTNRLVSFVLTGALLWVGAAAATPSAGTAELDVHEVSAQAAMPALRAIAGPERLDPIDADTVRVRGTAEEIDLAELVIELIDGAGSGDVDTRKASDGSVVARFALKRVSSRQAVRHLRALAIRQVAVVSEGPILLVRGSEEQIEAATRRMKALQQENAGR